MKLALFLTPTFTRLSQSSTVNKFLGLLAAGWNVHVFTPNGGVQNWFYSPPVDQPQVAERIHELQTVSSGANWLQGLGASIRHPLRSAQNWQRGRQLLDRGERQNGDGRLLSQLKAFQPDLIHFEFGFPAAKWHFLHKMLNCPMTVSLQAGALEFFLAPDFFQPIWQEAAGIHLPSESARRAALWYGLPGSLPHAVIPPSVDLTFYDPGERAHLDMVGSEERPLRLLSVCQLTWSKGIEHALEVVRLLLAQGIHCEYDIIGTGPYADALHFATKQLGFDGVVRFWGNQPRAQVRASLATADIFLHTAVADGFSYAVFEAMAMQLPIVGTAANGLDEHIQSGKTGFVLPIRDLPGIVEKTALLAKTPALRQQLGQAARAYMLAAIRPSEEITAFAQFFQQAAQVNIEIED